LRGTTVGNNTLLGQWLVLHASIFQHVGPLATGTGVAVFQMLAEVIGAEEFLGLVALAKFVDVVEMFGACLPAWRIGELLATVAADVRAIASHRRMESGFRTGERGA
jgi:hypothetical protein